MIIYEDTGQRDFNPKLPYYRVTHEGEVTASEPLILETTCRVDILLFPFDYQVNIHAIDLFCKYQPKVGLFTKLKIIYSFTISSIAH